MARKIRIEYAGAAYHVMARGNQGRDIYADERDRKLWLATLGEACEKTGWRIHAWVMMNNHYHLLLETPEANLVAGMKWLQGTYKAIRPCSLAASKRAGNPKQRRPSACASRRPFLSSIKRTSAPVSKARQMASASPASAWAKHRRSRGESATSRSSQQAGTVPW